MLIINLFYLNLGKLSYIEYMENQFTGHMTPTLFKYYLTLF